MLMLQGLNHQSQSGACGTSQELSGNSETEDHILTEASDGSL